MPDPTRICRGRGISLFAQLATVVVVCGWLNIAGAQNQPPQPAGTINGFEPRMRQLPERERRPQEDLDNYMDRVSATDAIVEVVVGQGKMLTVKQPLTRPGQEAPFIAVGDPTVIDFEAVDNFHIRITGLRIGVTDFSILTSDGNEYTFEIQVTADLDLLRHRLQAAFPEAQDLQVRQIRDHVIVDGRVPDGYTAAGVLKTIKAYLLSVQAAQASKVKAKTQTQPRDDAGPRPAAQPDDEPREGDTAPDVDKPDIEATIPLPQVISLLRTTHHDSLDTLHLSLKEKFPGASIRVTRTGRAIVAEGQARDAREVDNILRVIDAYLEAVLADEAALLDAANAIDGSGGNERVGGNDGQRPGVDVNVDGDQGEDEQRTVSAKPRIINLITVPGPQQVMLKVEVAELNRTAFRAIGLNWLFKDTDTVLGSRVGNGAASFAELFLPTNAAAATVFGILDDGKFQFVLNALRQNNVFKVLAEPTLVAMNGQEASFLAGGEFPVPVPQSGAGGGPATITVQYKEFGVALDFKPLILDEDTIRLSVGTKVSSIDENLGIFLQGFRVPALSERRASTSVQLKEGKTLAIAGLLSIELEGNTDRIPGLGDLEYIGPFFSNTDSRKVEKELVVLITPYIVDGMDRHEVPCRPGDMVEEPDDWELYLQNRIEKRNCKPYRATTAWYDTFHVRQRYCKWEEVNVVGPHGYSD